MTTHFYVPEFNIVSGFFEEPSQRDAMCISSFGENENLIQLKGYFFNPVVKDNNGLLTDYIFTTQFPVVPYPKYKLCKSFSGKAMYSIQGTEFSGLCYCEPIGLCYSEQKITISFTNIPYRPNNNLLIDFEFIYSYISDER